MTAKTEKTNKFAGLTRDQIWDLYGGENVRGAVSKAIIEMYQTGYTKSQIAAALNKRYQHVRNVLVELARKNG